jgi:Gluconate 2-dehydrogenase subunit 3
MVELEVVLEHSFFLSEKETQFFEALCETIVPAGDSEKEPGSLTVGGLTYIDSTLADMSEERKKYFRDALNELQELCRKRFSTSFSELNSEQRQTALREFYLNPQTREKMFDLRSVVLESFYSDYHSPDYHGMTAWQYVEFGGKRISDLNKDWRFVRIWKEAETKK